MQRDSPGYTLLVAAVLCVVCSVIVAGAAVGLRPKQQENKRVDRIKNVLLAAGLIDREVTDRDQIEAIYKERVERELIDLRNGKAVSLAEAGVEEDYDPADAAKDPAQNVAIAFIDDAAGIKNKPKYTWVYKVEDEAGELGQVVAPIYGKGLWSTMYGYLAVDAQDLTVRGITFYEHGETPGLGGEIENAEWQDQWIDKSIYGEGGEVQLEVVRGTADTEYEIDGLSGATITSKGVSNMIAYWLGPNGFKPYLDSLIQSAPEANTDG